MALHNDSLKSIFEDAGSSHVNSIPLIGFKVITFKEFAEANDFNMKKYSY